MCVEALVLSVHVCIMQRHIHTCVKGLCNWAVEHSGRRV